MALIDTFYEKGREFLNVETPIMCGAMTWVSEPNLVAAVCNAGAFACLAGGNTPVDILEEQIEETKRLTDKPFGVNLITIAPVYKDHLEMLKRIKLDYVVFAGGFPRQDEIKLAKAAGAKVMCFASTKSIAKRMQRYGADAIMLEGMEAGGHVGHVSLTVLLQQVLFEVDDIPVFVAGGIATGKMCAHLLLMGAAGVQMGTAFAVAEESVCHKDFKDKFIKSNARDAVSTPQYDSRLPVVAVRALRNKGMDEFGDLQLKLLKEMEDGKIGRTEAQLKVEEFWMGALRRAAIDGDIDRGSLMAGQSVGLIKEIKPVKDIVQDFVDETAKELERVKSLLA